LVSLVASVPTAAPPLRSTTVQPRQRFDILASLK
jgi:hypothetical protein